MAITSGIYERTRTYQSIKTALCAQLAEKRPTNGRLPPLRQLASDMGVGQSSLHQAIRELVSEGLLVSRPKLGTFINATPEEFRISRKMVPVSVQPQESRQPLADKWVQIMYYTPDQAEQFFLAAVNPLSDALSEFGLRCSRASLEHESPGQLHRHDKPDVLVVVNPSREVELICQAHQSLMVINTTQHCYIPQQDRFDLVALDDIQCGVVAGEHLKRLGWSNACFLGVQDVGRPMVFDKTSRDRLEGFEMGLGHPIPSEWRLCCANYEVIYGAEAVREWIKHSPRPPAVFAVSDDLAFGFINGAVTQGLRPGRDYQIIGLDGQQLNKDFGVGTITTVAADMADMGKLAAKLLLERLCNPRLHSRRVLVGGQLTPGDTVVANCEVAVSSSSGIMS